MKKLFLMMLCMTFCLAMVSANGLRIDPTTITVNKTVGVDENIIFTIHNDEPYAFYNISIDDDFGYITIDDIDELASGENITVNAIITADVNKEEDIRVKGFYISNVGEQNLEHFVNITGDSAQSFDVDPCDFTIIKGDSITWTNVDSYSTIHLRDMDSTDGSGNPIPIDGGIITRGSSFTKQFTVAGDFNYGVYLGEDLNFDLDTCSVVIQPTSGPVNDPDLDGVFHLSLTTDYEPTEITVTVVESDTSFRPFNKEEGGIISIKNSGDKIAKNVHLEGQWFTFAENDFDIQPGSTNNVEYYVEPAVSSTADTNKTYYQNITISGNFDQYSREFEVFVEYRENIDPDNPSAYGGIDELLREFCERNPDICTPVIIEEGGNGTQKSATFNITEEQWKDLWIHIFEESEARKTLDNYIKEEISGLSQNSNNNTAVITHLMKLFEEEKETNESSIKSIVIFIIIIFVVIACCVAALLIYLWRTKNKKESLRRY